MNFSEWLASYPEFTKFGWTNEAYVGANVLAELYLCHVDFDTTSQVYQYTKGLLVAHLFAVRQQGGGNPVEKSQSLESFMSFKVPDATSAFLNLSDTFYGRTVNDIVKLRYNGGLSLSFLCVGDSC